MNKVSLPNPFLHLWLAVWCALAALAMPSPARAQHELLIPGGYYWYAPAHEKYAPTTFYSAPQFNARQVRITRTQRFRLVAGQRNWFMLEFDQAGKVYIPMRLLRSMVHDQTAPDTWTAFERASVFFEDPAKIEARLRPGTTDPQSQPSAADSRVPSWKRYKDGWSVNRPGRTSALPAAGEGAETTSSPAPARPQDRKPKSKYPLLPPIGSEPKQDEAAPRADPSAGDGTNIPAPNLP